MNDSRKINPSDATFQGYFDQQTLKSLLCLLLLGFIWGSGYSIARYAMTHQVHPLGYAFWQSIGPACLLGLISFFQSDYSLISPKNWSFFFICALIGIAIPNTNMYFAASRIEAGTLAVIVNTVPLIVYPLALLCKQEKVDYGRLLALLIGFAGLSAVILPAGGFSWQSWHLIALITPLCFAVCAIYIASAKRYRIPLISSAAGMLLCASLILAPLVIWQNAFFPLSWPLNMREKVVILEIFLSSLGYLIFFHLLQTAGPVYYSLTGGIVAITGLFWGLVLFGEKPHMYQLIGTAFILLAITILSWRQPHQANKKDKHERNFESA